MTGGTWITVADEDAYKKFCELVACPECSDEQLTRVWENVKGKDWGEVNVTTGERPSSLSESPTTALTRMTNPDAMPPYKPKPLAPGEVVVIWEHLRLNPGKVAIKIRRI